MEYDFFSVSKPVWWYIGIENELFLLFAKIWKFLKVKLWSKAIIKVEPFFEGPDKKLGVENDGLEQRNIFTRPKI